MLFPRFYYGFPFGSPNLHVAQGTLHTAALIQDLLGSTARAACGGAWEKRRETTWHIVVIWGSMAKKMGV